MDPKPIVKQAFALRTVALFIMVLLPSSALAGKLGSKASTPTTAPLTSPPAQLPAVQSPSAAQGAVPNPQGKAGMWLMKSPVPKPPEGQGAGLPSPGQPTGQAALPMPPKHYKLDAEPGEVKFGDGQRGARLPTGQGASPKYKTGQGALGALPLPPPQGVSPADPTSPGIPGGVAEKGIIVQNEPGASKGSDTVPTEELSINYEEIKHDFKPQGEGKGGGNVQMEWKVEEGEK